VHTTLAIDGVSSDHPSPLPCVAWDSRWCCYEVWFVDSLLLHPQTQSYKESQKPIHESQGPLTRNFRMALGFVRSARMPRCPPAIS